MSKPTIVLVHGAWTDGSSWNAVASALRSQGFRILTPTNLLRGAADAEYVASFIAQRTTGPVVLVGHSYGGVVITNAVIDGSNVKALVYVDAFIPDEGETLAKLMAGSGSAFDVEDPTTVLDLVGYPGGPEGDTEAFLKPQSVHNFLAQDLPEADRFLIIESQRPITGVAGLTPSGPAAWKSLPSWVVVGIEDRIIPHKVQRTMAERAGATVSDVTGSHLSIMSKPQSTVDAILAAAAVVEG
jgi:pimeloyl-ACP methyl ester carboxylesterase